MADKYTCPQCGTNQRNYPMMVSIDGPRVLCAHYTHRRFLDVAFNAQKHIHNAAWAGFCTGVVVVGGLWAILK